MNVSLVVSKQNTIAKEKRTKRKEHLSHTVMTTNTATHQYRALEEYQDAVRAAGTRVYQCLPSTEKERLTKTLTEALCTASHNDNESVRWVDVVDVLVEDAVKRNQAAATSSSDARENGSSAAEVDVQLIVKEVMPLVLAAIPQDVREALFSQIKTVLGAESSPM